MAVALQDEFSRTNVRWTMETAARNMVSGSLEGLSSPGRRFMSPPAGRMGAPIGGLGMSQRLAGGLKASRSAPTLPPLLRGTSAASQPAPALAAGPSLPSDLMSHEELSQAFSTVDLLIQEAKNPRTRLEDPRQRETPVTDKHRELPKRKKKAKKYGPAMSLELKLQERREAMAEKAELAGKASATQTNGFGMVVDIPMYQHQVQGRRGNETHNLVDVKGLRQSCKVPMDESAANRSVKNLLAQRERTERARKLEQEQARQRRALQRMYEEYESSHSPSHAQRHQVRYNFMGEAIFGEA